MNDYQLEKQIGSGTFGDVYKGIEIHSGMKVAIKRIKKKILYENGKYLLKSYYKEIECMKKCSCENSIKFIKDFPTQNYFNIIMELCDTDLLCYLYQRQNPFKIEEIRDTFIQLNNAFRKMHQNNILHRDLKLGNILLKFTDDSKKSFIPKLSDYGFSKELNKYNYTSITHLGTPATMAPEIMNNKPYNEKSDLWSIGVMLYQLYYREIPFDGKNEAEIIQKIESNIPSKQPDDNNFRDLINRLLVVSVKNRLSWNEYFSHPFFTGNMIKKNNINLFISFSYQRSLSFDDNKDLDFNNSSKSLEENFFVHGDIYGKTETKKSSKEILNEQKNLKVDNNFENKVELLVRGRGINDYEYQIIIESCIEAKDNNLFQISQNCINNIKNKINGEWLVFISNDNYDNYDFFLSFIVNQCYVVFKYKGNQFQVCQFK